MAFLSPFPGQYPQTDAVLSAVRTSAADLTTRTTINLGVAGLKFIKGAIVAKSGAGVYTSAGTWGFKIVVSPSTGVTTLAEIVALTPLLSSSVELAAGNTSPNSGFMFWQFSGGSNSSTGFRHVFIEPIVSSTISGTFDIEIFAA